MESRPIGSRRGRALVLALLVVVPAAVYLGSLPVPFHYDDLHSIQRNPHLRLENIPAFFHDPGLFDENPATRMYRPALLVSYAVDAWFWGRNPLGFHLTNLLLHLGVGVVLYRLLRAWLPARVPPGIRTGASLLGALVFLLHPVASEGVVYVSCRSSQLATLGYLGALFAYTRFRRARGSVRPWAWLAGVAACAALAFGSKAIAVTLPAALVLVEMLVLRRGSRRGTDRASGAGVDGGGAADGDGQAAGSDRAGRVRPAVRAAVALALVVTMALGYLAIRREVMGSTGVNLSAQRMYHASGHALTGSRSVESNLYTQARVFWRYVGLLVWPASLNIAHHAPVLTRMADPRVWMSVAGLVLYALAALLLWRRGHGRLAFALAWLPVTLSPTSSIVPLNVVMSEHRLYLPMTLTVALPVAMGGAWIASLFAAHPARRRGFAVASAVVLGLLGACTAWRTADYRSEERLWGGAVALAPENFRARNYLGNALVARGAFELAREHYRAAHAVYPAHMDTRINLGEVNLRLASSGHDPVAWGEAESLFRSVIADEPRHVLARLKLGRLLMLRAGPGRGDMDDLEEARFQFGTVVTLTGSPRYRSIRTWARLRLAELYERTGDILAAVQTLQAVVRDVPFHAEARQRLARLSPELRP